MYAFTSFTSGKSLHIITVASLSAAILLFTVSSVEGIPLPWVLQLAGIATGAFGVYMLTRYSLRAYRYELAPSNIVAADGQSVPDLTVTQTVGRRETVVCRVSLRDITAVTVWNRPTFKANRASFVGEMTLFRYENTPFEPLSCYISAPAEHSVIVIPADERMVNILTEIAAANTANVPDPDET